MVNWDSAEEIQRNFASFVKLTHALLGLYLWEWLFSLDFDWQFISGQKRFRWPLIFYFLNRYALLMNLIVICIGVNVTSPLNCPALATLSLVFSDLTMGTAGINLSLRTMAVWSNRWYIVIPLVAIILGQWSLIFYGLKAQPLVSVYLPGTGCVLAKLDISFVTVIFIYTMCQDFIVLCLMAFRLYSDKSNSTRLIRLIFKDGLIYFALAFLSNLLGTIFMLINLNMVMSIIANIPACVVQSIAACRVVRRLSQYDDTDPKITTMLRDMSFATRSGFQTQTSYP